MILEDIERVLKEFDPIVFYGMAQDADPITKEPITIWNYIVFNRVNIRHTENKNSAGDYFDVHIIRENYVPEGIDDEIIKKLCALAGVKLADTDCTFDYVQKPNTDIVVEMLTIHFVRARKRCSI